MMIPEWLIYGGFPILGLLVSLVMLAVGRRAEYQRRSEMEAQRRYWAGRIGPVVLRFPEGATFRTSAEAMQRMIVEFAEQLPRGMTAELQGFLLAHASEQSWTDEEVEEVVEKVRFALQRPGPETSPAY